MRLKQQNTSNEETPPSPRRPPSPSSSQQQKSSGLKIIDPAAGSDVNLIINQDSEEIISKCTVTLQHPGTSTEYIAYKLFTTHPRRYFVSPHQGLVGPGSSVVVTISLSVEARDVILEEYDTLGSLVLDRAKDKFLVQSCVVSNNFYKQFVKNKNNSNHDKAVDYDSHHNVVVDEDEEILTAFWISVNGPGSANLIHNQKIRLRIQIAGSLDDKQNNASDDNNSLTSNTLEPYRNSLTVQQREFLKHSRDNLPSLLTAVNSTDSNDNSNHTSNDVDDETRSRKKLENMTKEQMINEVLSLRHKYKEMVCFAIDLADEHEVLHNKFESAKRKLKREEFARVALENKLYDIKSQFGEINDESQRKRHSGSKLSNSSFRNTPRRTTSSSSSSSENNSGHKKKSVLSKLGFTTKKKNKD